MKLGVLLAVAALSAAAQAPGPRTLRLDYVHTGTATEEHFALDGVVLEGAWPGPLDRWVDESNLGKYYFQVLDRGTNRVIYSRGFASIYGEWETTDEAKAQRRALRGTGGRILHLRCCVWERGGPARAVGAECHGGPGGGSRCAAEGEGVGGDAKRASAR